MSQISTATLIAEHLKWKIYDGKSRLMISKFQLIDTLKYP